jgi:hypothetical protein
LLQLIYMGLSINGDTPIAGWFIMEKTYSNGWFSQIVIAIIQKYGWLSYG